MPDSEILLRPVRLDDAEALHEIRRQPQVMRHTNATPFERLPHMRGFIEKMGPMDAVMVAVLDGRIAGMAGLHVRDGKQRHSAHMGIMVHDDLAGRGVGSALMRSLVDIADKWIGLVRVDLEVDADNERAQRLYARFGFVEEGRRRKAFQRDGEFTDILLMARLRDGA